MVEVCPSCKAEAFILISERITPVTNPFSDPARDRHRMYKCNSCGFTKEQNIREFQHGFAASASNDYY